MEVVERARRFARGVQVDTRARVLAASAQYMVLPRLRRTNPSLAFLLDNHARFEWDDVLGRIVLTVPADTWQATVRDLASGLRIDVKIKPREF